MSIDVNIEDALERLHKFDRRGIHVYRKSDLRRLFFDDSLTAFQQSLLRLVKAGVRISVIAIARFGLFRSPDPAVFLSSYFYSK
ncbi:hypothetical protein [Vibrio parahaemolyticus]|uniref:hypothetical protein n=1 Tax=Vibrio parahaemolyticus TaxID=670 RepID=UPI002B20AB04|nr:hypothetical protein [Vibrio parahaemolyticus]MEA5275226.1 hypothetical protein [Vibrio parahaemolyticus]